MAADEGAAVFPSPIYQELKAWIAHQEAYEVEHQKPAPLTDAQRKAVQALRLPAAIPPTADGPPLNYVGLLMEFYQKRNQLSALHWEEAASSTLYTPEAPGGVTGRVCRVTIADSLAHAAGPIDHFPAAGWGLSPDGAEPRFASKKAAKHFAAKCAVQWMAAQGLMYLPYASAGSALLSPPPPPPSSSSSSSWKPTPSQQPAAVVATVAGTPSLKRAMQGAHHALSSLPPPKRQTMAPTPPSAPAPRPKDSTAPPVEQVRALCVRLNITAPRYRISPTGPHTTTFDGEVVLDHYGDAEQLAVMEASRVQGVDGMDNAKRAVASKVLAALRVVEAQREALCHKVLG